MKEKRQQVSIQLYTCHLLFYFLLLILHKRTSTITIYFNNKNSERVKFQWANHNNKKFQWTNPKMKWAIAHLPPPWLRHWIRLINWFSGHKRIVKVYYSPLFFTVQKRAAQITIFAPRLPRAKERKKKENGLKHLKSRTDRKRNK